MDNITIALAIIASYMYYKNKTTVIQNTDTIPEHIRKFRTNI
jgi:hypothetical protein